MTTQSIDLSKSGEIVTPVEQHTIDRVTVATYGRSIDWALRELTDQAALEHGSDAEEFSKLRGVVENEGFQQVLLPTRLGERHDRIAEPGEFSVCACVGSGEFRLRRHYYTDGVLLNPSAPVLLPTGDCPVVVLENITRGTAIAVHCGRDQLIDRSDEREYESVLDIALQDRRFRPNNTDRIRAYVTAGIGPHHFVHRPDDPRYREVNRRLIDKVCRFWGEGCFLSAPEQGLLDIAEVARKQLRQHGVARTAKSTLETFTHPGLWSNRAGEDGRNGILVWMR